MKNYIVTVFLSISIFSGLQGSGRPICLDSLFRERVSTLLHNPVTLLEVEATNSGHYVQFFKKWLLKNINPFVGHASAYSPNVSIITPSVFSLLEKKIIEHTIKSNPLSRLIVNLYRKLHTTILERVKLSYLQEEYRKIRKIKINPTREECKDIFELKLDLAIALQSS